MYQAGDKLDSVVTAKFSKCGTLNGKTIDIKVVCSDIVIKGTEDWQLSWTAYGTTDKMINFNEWWYYNTEHVKVNVYFYYTGSNTPITFNNAYLSIYSEDKDEGCASQTATDRYLYEKTDMVYTPTWKSNVNSGVYHNVFYGGDNQPGNGTNSGTLRCVSFRYQNVNNIEVELLTLNPETNSGAGYHLEYISLTATKPDNPKKKVDKTVVNTGDTITYTVTQNISKATDKNFY